MRSARFCFCFDSVSRQQTNKVQGMDWTGNWPFSVRVVTIRISSFLPLSWSHSQQGWCPPSWKGAGRRQVGPVGNAFRRSNKQRAGRTWGAGESLKEKGGFTHQRGPSSPIPLAPLPHNRPFPLLLKGLCAANTSPICEPYFSNRVTMTMAKYTP